MDNPERLRIDRKSTADQVAAVLREEILQGQLRSGTRLREVSLADTFRISRNTMREALRLLVYEGLVQHSPHQGAAVTSLTAADVTDIYGVRKLVELAAVEASRGAPAGEFEELRELLEEMRASSQARNWPRTVECDMRFHCRLVGFLENERISTFVRTALAELRLGLVLVDRAGSETGAAEQLDEQRRIVDLLAEGRQDECAEVLLEHLSRAEAKVCAVVATETDAAAAAGS